MSNDPNDHNDDNTHNDDDNTDNDQLDTALPWWRSPRNLVAILVAVVVLASSAAFVLGEWNATPDPNGVDVGYLQDMRAHHEQAVEMSLIFLGKSDTHPTLRLIAKEIAFGQAVDIGRMIQLLRDFDQPEANESGTGMGWMNEPLPIDRMPGLATESDLEALIGARGAQANITFATLMIAHHQGGIHMADYAADKADTREVRDMAKSMSRSQAGEITELKQLLAAP